MKKNIALFISFLDNEFSMDVIDGAWLAAEDMDVNLFILPVRLMVGNYNEEKLNRYEYQFNSMLSYVDKGNFDGVILETGVVCNGLDDAAVQKLFASFGNVPVVSIARKVQGYPNVCFTANGLRDEIQHLIDVHGCKRIGFIGGPVNNAEAQERFTIYQNTLAANQIPFDESLCGVGNFTEYCIDTVNEVLERNRGNIDALCFANDRMAIGGYRAILQSGLSVGKDVRVTGFDDAPSASAMQPMLTTVRSNVSTLGYRAVGQCVSMIQGNAGNDVNIDTSIIVRSSCGCLSKVNVMLEKIRAAGSVEQMDARVLCDEIASFLSGALHDETSIGRNIKMVSNTFYDLLCELQKPNFDSEAELAKIVDAINTIDFESMPYNEFSFALTQIRKWGTAHAADREKALEFFYDICNRIMSQQFTDSYYDNQSYRSNLQISSSIVHDVLCYMDDEDESLFSIIHNMRRHGAKNSYLFIHDFPIICRSFAEWHRPRTEKLVCYHQGQQEVLIPKEEQSVSADCCFRIPQLGEERHTIIGNPLFYDEEHYGLLLTEIDKKETTFLAWVIVKQIAYALKTRQLMEKQIEEQERLSKDMQAIALRNQLLLQTSISDELTGCLNRRGFMEKVSEELMNPINRGKRAVLAFVDMNNLKLVNDHFGHDEGDFAIRGVAEILSQCFRDGDLIARFGGDEFVAFCFSDVDSFEEMYRSRVKRATEMFNAKSHKPYILTLSTGIYEFTCVSSMNLTQCLNVADDLLYEDKKHKPMNILREEE